MSEICVYNVTVVCTNLAFFYDGSQTYLKGWFSFPGGGEGSFQFFKGASTRFCLQLSQIFIYNYWLCKKRVVTYTSFSSIKLKSLKHSGRICLISVPTYSWWYIALFQYGKKKYVYLILKTITSILSSRSNH